MADYKFGSMDTTSQQKSFDGFVKATKWSVIAILVILALMAIFTT